MAKLILWDVDATLLTTGGVGGDVMRAAMAQVFGGTMSRERTFYSGKTDRQIIHDTYPDLTPARLLEQLQTFTGAYVAEFERRRPDLLKRAHALEGASALLRAFHGTTLQAPLTGNIRAIAQRKLDLVGLLPYLTIDLGAYGDDHHDRAELVPIAASRTSGYLGRPLRGCDIVVVGDTPHDIRCGRRNGTRTVAVATGPYSLDDLRRYEPDALLSDLRDFDAAQQAILGESPDDSQRSSQSAS
jgi:phosphoglycolate phosphatase-like HAD superfamily hydrolase